MYGTSLRADFRQILGVTFFNGSASEAVSRLQSGGLLVVPAAPALKNLTSDTEYREALLNADLVITDSGLMVMAWNLLQGDSVRRLSGLEYMREFLKRPSVCQAGKTFWLMASPASAAKNIAWLRTQGLEVGEDDYYVAPMYGRPIEDRELVDRLRERRPEHVVVTIGGGTQERLGLYLKSQLEYPVAVHCIGAAIAFLSGDQVHIPHWADRLYLGWLFRCIADPKRYGPRYWDARHLMVLLVRYRERMPELRA
jgi:N-acetylglucosaminyldiphosphoundecaprenol N-acetyl-beta-D-mannosaminyltransferase